MPAYFSDASLKFLKDLARHNEREWFNANKARYESHVREPFRRLLADLQPALTEQSEHYRADPRTVGGSLFRIHRDTRFSNNKAPYKTWQGARLFHERSRNVEAPGYYIHLQPGNCFVAAGIWHPGADSLRRIRHFILDNPGAWTRVTGDSSFRRRYALDDSEMLTRMPRGFPPEFGHAEDLRRKNFVAVRNIDDATMTGPRLRAVLEKDLAGLAPLIDYLCAALDLDF
ncbi:DUF2461 domain-containing protein [Marilutibacter chinensis]|uniref:DUF2461 domain-containing protein n=1 Tax=Marilutibacter chinensis TaxID=2912247 RepID=A0ABS9HMM1_9GAMM|nr:DUF2461 domain-containing protein [Lysobacter chinensis]MCF7220266.1 DUF2461 domain-containing protein [Lysobacter chinensis]